MSELYDKEGNPVEGALTPQEIETQKQEAVQAALEPLKTELEQAKADLNKAGDKDHNFAQLRTRVEIAEQKINTAKEDALKEFEQNQSARTAESLIKKLSDGDEELKKKIEFHFKRLGEGAKTEDEIAKQVRDAWVLVRNDSVAPDPMSGAFNSGGANPVMPPKPNLAKPPLSENQAAFLRTYANMSDEEIKKLNDSAAPVKFQSPDGNFTKVVI